MQFGGVSKVLGYDISGSATGVGYNLPGAYFNALADMVALGALGGKWLVKGEVSRKEAWEAVQQMPKQIAGPMEPFIRSGIFDTTALKDPNMKGDPRSELDQVVRIFSGMKSLNETALNTSERLFKMDEARINKEISDLSQLVKENGMTEEYYSRLLDLATTYGVEPQRVVSAIVRYQLENDKSPMERRARGISTPRGASRYERYMEERSREPTR
jgi:hypothetical protein